MKPIGFIWNEDKRDDQDFSDWLNRFENSSHGSVYMHFVHPGYRPINDVNNPERVWLFNNENSYDEFIKYVRQIEGWNPDFITLIK
jgi:hypothetical protein